MNSDGGYYLFSLLVLIGVYVFGHSIMEGLRKKYSWRWGVILLMAMYAFYLFGARTGTFVFMYEKSRSFISSPPWKSNESVANER